LPSPSRPSPFWLASFRLSAGLFPFSVFTIHSKHLHPLVAAKFSPSVRRSPIPIGREGRYSSMRISKNRKTLHTENEGEEAGIPKLLINKRLCNFSRRCRWTRDCDSYSTMKNSRNLALGALALLIAVATLSVTALAQEPPAAAFKFAVFHRDSVEASSSFSSPSATSRTEQHKFWDRGNSLLFAAVAATSAADFVVTKSNLDKGGNELNPATRLFGRSTVALAANFAGETAGVVGLSYFFHKTGHHKLERAVSLVDIGASTTAVSYDLAHR
jgi:hypothetical protein